MNIFDEDGLFLSDLFYSTEAISASKLWINIWGGSIVTFTLGVITNHRIGLKSVTENFHGDNDWMLVNYPLNNLISKALSEFAGDKIFNHNGEKIHTRTSVDNLRPILEQLASNFIEISINDRSRRMGINRNRKIKESGKRKLWINEHPEDPYGEEKWENVNHLKHLKKFEEIKFDFEDDDWVEIEKDILSNADRTNKLLDFEIEFFEKMGFTYSDNRLQEKGPYYTLTITKHAGCQYLCFINNSGFATRSLTVDLREKPGKDGRTQLMRKLIRKIYVELCDMNLDPTSIERKTKSTNIRKDIDPYNEEKWDER